MPRPARKRLRLGRTTFVAAITGALTATAHPCAVDFQVAAMELA